MFINAPKVKTVTIPPDLGLISKTVFKKEAWASVFERHRWPSVVCTWHVRTLGLTLAGEQVRFRLAAGVIPGTLAFEVLLSILSCSSHFSPPTDGAGDREPGVLLRLRAQQFDLLCFLFCPSLKGKDVPTLLQDCTPLCPDNHETAWETESLSPRPLPPLEKNC